MFSGSRSPRRSSRPPLATLVVAEAICELTPITAPAESISGPPELPGFSAASVWIV